MQTLPFFAIGLGVAFVLAMTVLVLFMIKSRIDHGFLGLMFLLTLVLFLVAFSFIVAASVPGYEIKVAVGVIDAFILVANKLLSDRFVIYLES